MSDCNKVLISGNLVRDPKIFTTNSGSKIANFTIACKKEWVSRGGEAQSQTNFPQCKAFGKLAEMVEKLTKGDNVVVLGELQTGDYEKEGRKVYFTEVNCAKVVPFALPKQPKYDHASAAAGDEPYPGGEPSPLSEDGMDLPF